MLVNDRVVSLTFALYDILCGFILGMQKFEYDGKKFCNECFTCGECAKPIGNNSFVPKEEGKLICMPCYNEKYAQRCGKCGEVVSNPLKIKPKKSMFLFL